jgi:hypothetical protein
MFDLRSWILLSLLAGLACGRATPEAVEYATGAGATTPDGLHRIEWEPFQSTYVKPGADLKNYDKVMVKEVTISYKTPPRPSQVNQNAIDPNYAIPPSALASMKKWFRKCFDKELGNSEFYTVTDAPGPDVLLLSGHIVDLKVSVPTEGDLAPDESVFTADSGSMTLILEARDSQSGETLVRVSQNRAVQAADGGWYQVDPVTNSSAVREVFSDWAEDLRLELDQFHELKVIPPLPTVTPPR